MEHWSLRRRRVVPFAVALLVVAGLVRNTFAADVSTSEPVARELVTLMTQRNLNAFAAKDPQAPNTFVAALLFPNVQLLVVAGEPTAPAATEAQLDQQQYADVYTTVQQAVDPKTKVFFQDLKADGLHPKADAAMDIVYEHVSNQTVFDGEPAKHHLSDAQYAQRFRDADARYARLLHVLVDALKQRAVGTKAGQ